MNNWTIGIAYVLAIVCCFLICIWRSTQKSN